MFGQNEIKGQSYFKDVGDKLLVTSIFLTIQGEGPFQGRPAVFVRLAYCNLDCSFCDTFFDQGDWYSIAGLQCIVLDMIAEKYRHFSDCGVVLTGGEPSLQKNIAPFLLGIDEAGVGFTQIESNGILFNTDLPGRTALVISPKCSEKTGKYLKPNEQALAHAKALKFVVTADNNSPYHIIPEWAFEWKYIIRNRAIYISPMNMYQPEALKAARERVQARKQHDIKHRSTVDEVVSAWDDKVLDREANRINHNYAAEYCLDNALFLTLQMHLYAAIA